MTNNQKKLFRENKYPLLPSARPKAIKEATAEPTVEPLIEPTKKPEDSTPKPFCKCNGKCRTKRCICKKDGSYCSIRCTCDDCDNMSLD